MASIARAGPADAPALARLAARAFDDPWSLDTFRAELERAGTLALVAREGGEPIGYALAWRLPDGAELQSLAVEPERRRRGVARALLARLIDELAAGGATRLVLEVRESNAPARSLYASLGLEAEGRRPRYYAGGEAALLLGRVLS